MIWSEFLWTTFGAIMTLSTFSFLYKDNPFYKIAEHLVVGVSAGYFVILLYYNGLVPKLLDPIQQGMWWYFVPGLLGVLMWFRFSKKLSWISRYPIAFYIGIATGVAIPVEMKARVNIQLAAIMDKPAFELGWFAGVSDIFIVIGSLCALFYFFFSKAHKGVFGGLAKTGIYILMVGFGASFGYTVMARISLFIQRVQSIRDWIAAAKITSDGQGMYIVWAVTILIVLVVIFEIIKHLNRRPSQAGA